MAFRSHFIQCAGLEMHYTEWGAEQAPVVIAWHGLARNCRDMDELARHLSSRYRVICPDTIGRGWSQWSPQPAQHYCLAFYARMATEMFDQLGIAQAHWVGTSMGGAIGTVCAAGLFEPTMQGRIRSLTLNDNAPALAEPALARIRDYAGKPPAFATLLELEAYFRQIYQSFGWLSDAQWRLLTESSARRLPDGRVTTHYDPAMVQQFVSHPNDYALWRHYDALQIPVLCLHGVASELVLDATIAEMGRRGPGATGRLQVMEVADCGHAPALNVPVQLDRVMDFIDGVEAA